MFFMQQDGGGGGAGEGGGSAGGAPGGGEFPAAPAPDSGAAGGAPAPAAASQFDPRGAYESLNQRYGQTAQELQQTRDALQQLYQATQQGNARWTDMQGLMKKMAGIEDKPQPEWQGAMQQMQQGMQQQMRQFFMEQKLRAELPTLEKEASDLFGAAATPEEKQDVRNFLVAAWSSFQNHAGKGHDSLGDTVKFINGLVNKVVESKQRAWATGKQGTQDALRGSGPPGSPRVQAPPGQQQGQRKPGFDSLDVTDDDVREALAAVKGSD